jgi:hypothetical protein
MRPRPLPLQAGGVHGLVEAVTLDVAAASSCRAQAVASVREQLSVIRVTVSCQCGRACVAVRQGHTGMAAAPPRLLRRVARLAAGATLLGSTGAAAYYSFVADEGGRRAFQMYTTFGPLVAHYRWLEAKQRWLGTPEPTRAAEWRALDDRFAGPTVRKLAELQGMYVKYGQTLAGFQNTFSPTWIAQFRTLEDQVPPRSAAVVARTIEEETGRPLSETFSEFDPVPLGSASIGQVHRARLRESGTEVAVKVQYPEVQQLFLTDMGAIRSFLSLVSPKHLFTLNQLQQQLEPECDYRLEAASLQEVADNMVRAG